MDKEKLKRELYNLASSDQYARLFLSAEDPELFPVVWMILSMY